MRAEAWKPQNQTLLLSSTGGQCSPGCLLYLHPSFPKHHRVTAKPRGDISWSQKMHYYLPRRQEGNSDDAESENWLLKTGQPLHHRKVSGTVGQCRGDPLPQETYFYICDFVHCPFNRPPGASYFTLLGPFPCPSMASPNSSSTFFLSLLNKILSHQCGQARPPHTSLFLYLKPPSPCT